MSMNIRDFSKKQLDILITQARKHRMRLSKRKSITLVRNKLIAMAKSEGYTIEELFNESTKKVPVTIRKAKKPSKKVPQKYRNPLNSNEIWTGRGNKPRWLSAELAKGKTIESFLIDKS